MTQQLQQIIDTAWENRASISPAAAPKEVADALKAQGYWQHVEEGEGE